MAMVMVIIRNDFFYLFSEQKTWQNICGDDKIKIYVSQHIQASICTPFDDYNLTIKPMTEKLVSSFNGSLCTYWMRQNLHNKTHLRS